ncbi:N-acetyltransferase [Agromyces protaetiae]|uniref:N-acetyltransferase n=1 Tax=Agromyces protaetiae TaxID=2509455 RepID=A0A4P6FLX2_9MICO|nr:N-acetyltransferase [Agromyces protaetiae]
MIRLYRPADRDQVAEVCLKTAASGGDATGKYFDDLLMPDVFALPYVEYAPDLAFVVAETTADGRPDRVLGYCIGVADTADFIDWWTREWTPGFAARHPLADAVARPFGQGIFDFGLDPERMRIAELADYPAHLHIDLLPELQGLGFGRKLIDTMRAALAARGVPALHLGVDPRNTGARAFYERLGFHELPSSTPTAPLYGIATSD